MAITCNEEDGGRLMEDIADATRGGRDVPVTTSPPSMAGVAVVVAASSDRDSLPPVGVVVVVFVRLPGGVVVVVVVVVVVDDDRASARRVRTERGREGRARSYRVSSRPTATTTTATTTDRDDVDAPTDLPAFAFSVSRRGRSTTCITTSLIDRSWSTPCRPGRSSSSTPRYTREHVRFILRIDGNGGGGRDRIDGGAGTGTTFFYPKNYSACVHGVILKVP